MMVHVTPIGSSGAWRWLRVNLFNSWSNSLLTVGLLVALTLLLRPAVVWLLWGAHWPAVTDNLRLFAIGLYPAEQVWRPGVLLVFIAFLFGGSASGGGDAVRYAALMLFIGLLGLTVLPVGQARLWSGLAGVWQALGFWFGRQRYLPRVWWRIGWLLSLPIVLLGLGGCATLGFSRVSTTQWGGLMLTVLLAFVSIAVSFPLGLLLALGRRSSLPVIRLFSVLYIELVRGVPLVSVLMMFALLLPLFLPATLGRPDMLLRAMVGMTLFTAAYVAENIRGGLQAISRGQYEAATAIGLSWAQSMRYIILPQALRAVIPALVGQFIALFKDTSLVTIVGLLELLGIAKSVIEQPPWKRIVGGVVFEVFIFTAVLYFIFTYTMSLASRRLERALGVGRR